MRRPMMLGFGLLLGVLVALPALSLAATFVWLRGAAQVWLTNSTSVASGSSILSGPITLTSANYTRADCELNVPAWTGTVTANTGVVVWLIRSVDAIPNYEDGAAGTDPARMPDMVFPLRGGISSAQRIILPNIELPRGLFKALVKNDGTGAAMNGASTAWTLTCTPFILQSS
jgi:hypothetical protein